MLVKSRKNCKPCHIVFAFFDFCGSPVVLDFHIWLFQHSGVLSNQIYQSNEKHQFNKTHKKLNKLYTKIINFFLNVV